MLLNLFFGKRVPASHFVGVVEQVRGRLARALEEFAAAEEDAPPEDRENPGPPLLDDDPQVRPPRRRGDAPVVRRDARRLALPSASPEQVVGNEI